jgi:carbamoyl-phosphate synthase large subunit
MNILISSAGGPASVGLIKSIRNLNQNHNIVSIDCDSMAAGLFLSDKYYVVPQVKEVNNFWEIIQNIIEKNDINFILPTDEATLGLFSKYRKKLKTRGIKIWVSPVKTIKLCNNKFKFWKKLHNEFDMPFIVSNVLQKPDKSSGARGVKLISPPKDNHLWEYLPGEEYTVDVFCDHKSISLGTIVRKRNGIKAGISVKGSIVRHKYLENESERLCKFLKIQGPCCIQWKENKDGKPKLIECNPRLGGGTYFATLAGVNPAEIYLNNIKTKQFPREIKVTRYFEEIII